MPSRPPSRRVARPADSPIRRSTISARAIPLALFSVLALLLAACGAASTPAPTAGATGVALVPGAAVSRSVGPSGGELTASDAAGGRTYRLSVPPGAFAEEAEVTLSPIASIEGFPLDDLLGGVELSPEGALFLGPVTLQISLDPGQRDALRSALDDGQVVAGFSYPGGSTSVADDLGITLAAVAEDASSVTLSLTSFSGHGAGTGNPQSLRGRPCPTDPARHAECEIHKILHPPGGPADTADPAVRSQVAQVFRDWLDVLEVVIGQSNDTKTFNAAIVEANAWWKLALLSLDDLVTEVWSAPGDGLYPEGQRLAAALRGAWNAAFDRANFFCQSTVRATPGGGLDLDEVLYLLEIHAWVEGEGGKPPALSGIAALQPSQFCAQLTLTAETTHTNPTELGEGDAGQFRFRIKDSNGAICCDAQLELMSAEVTATSADLSVLTATGDRLGVLALADVTAVRAVPGNDSEGRFTIQLSLFRSSLAYASANVSFDIKPGVADPIRCSGDPTTIRSINDDVDKIAIISDGAGSCSVLDEENSRDDDPNIVLRLDTDAGETRWDGDRGDGGINWTGEGEGDGQAPGTYRFTVRHVPSGATYTLAFTVELSLINGGPDVTMTLRDVTLTPTP